MWVVLHRQCDFVDSRCFKGDVALAPPFKGNGWHVWGAAQGHDGFHLQHRGLLLAMRMQFDCVCPQLRSGGHECPAAIRTQRHHQWVVQEHSASCTFMCLHTISEQLNVIPDRLF